MKSHRLFAVAAAIVLVGFISLVIPGCESPKAGSDPLAVMVDRGKSPTTRLKAAEQAEAESGQTPRFETALRTLIMDAGHPAEMRTWAIDALIRMDEARAKAFLADAVMLLNNWDAIHHVLDKAVELKWVDFTPAIVRSYSRTARALRDEDRPERQALTALNPGRTPEQVIFDVFDSDDRTTTVKQRAAAWELLSRLASDRAELVELLSRASARTALVADLKAGAIDLGIVPHNAPTLAWLQTLRTSEYATFWAQAKAVVATLNDQQKSGIELRHLPSLVWLKQEGSAVLGMSREQLAQQLLREDADFRHYLKSTEHDGQNADHPQRLRYWIDQLRWADLVMIRHAVDMTRQATVRAVIFAQADADHRDERTEYGGLIFPEAGGQLTIRPYEPMLTKHDRTFIPTTKMMIDGYMAMFHYHFHAQEYSNARYAGPGLGDLENIGERHRMNGLVFIFINENTLNVDYYQHGRVVVDLGTIER